MRRSVAWVVLCLLAAPAAPALAATLHVDASSKVKPPDGSEEAPFRTIAPALELASAGDVVEVAPGVYDERVTLKPGVALRGSGDGDTVIDVSDFEPEGVAVICADDASLEGFRVVDPSPPPHAAIDCSGASSEIAGNRIEVPGRTAIGVGFSSYAWIHHNTILGGPAIPGQLLASIEGEGRPLIEDNEIASNGVAISLLYYPAEDLRLRRNLLRGRVRVGPIAGVTGVELTVANNLFLPSRGALDDMGGLELVGEPEDVQVVGNTFFDTRGIQLDAGTAFIANNLLVDGAAGIALGEEAGALISHNDVVGNRVGIIGPPTDYVGVEDQTGSNGNVSAAPDFVDSFLDDFRLRPGSPALDAGSDGFVAAGADLDGDSRIVDGDDDAEPTVDMGAQELQPDEELPLPALPIAIDVVPGKSPNELKFTKVSKGSGKVSIAILSDSEIVAPVDVDPATLILEREPVLGCKAKDVNRDDTRDLVCSFPLSGIGLGKWPIAVPPACVRGELFEGRKLLGCDQVEILP